LPSTTAQSALLVSDPAGELVLSGSEDHHVYAWHLNSRSVAGLLRGRPSEDTPGDGHCDAVLAVDANPVLPMIASGGYERDRTVKLWAPPPRA
jgi:COMPASS component SWD3